MQPGICRHPVCVWRRTIILQRQKEWLILFDLVKISIQKYKKIQYNEVIEKKEEEL